MSQYFYVAFQRDSRQTICFHFLQFNSVSEFWNIIEFFKLIQFFFVSLRQLVFLELIIGHNHLFSIVQKYSQSSQE